MTYIVVSSNEIVKAEMERPHYSHYFHGGKAEKYKLSMKRFESHIASLPRIPAPGHKWKLWSEVELNKDFELKPVRTWTERNGEYGCAECCNRDRCDEDCDATYYRPNCPYCKGKGWFKEIPVIAIPIQPTPEGEKVEEKIVFTKREFIKYTEWLRVNGERHRGNLQKNGMELYYQYLKENNHAKKI